MVTFELGVEDLADTRFATSPLHETVLSLRVLRDPGLCTPCTCRGAGRSSAGAARSTPAC